MFKRLTAKGINYWQEEAFAQKELVQHAFSERGADGDFNLALHTGDEPKKVINNRRVFTAALDIDMAQTVTMEQVHGLNIAQVGKKDCGRGMYDYQDSLKATDGLITDEKNVALMGCFADCVPLIFLDPQRKVIALSHAGWKGTVGGIAGLTAEKMVQEYNCAYGDIMVAVGPSIGPCHYEVDRRVINEVQKFAWWQKVLTPTAEEHAMLNLWECNRLQLLELGLKEANIFVSGLCTYCHNDKFFSYRAENGRTGRIAAIIMLK